MIERNLEFKMGFGRSVKRLMLSELGIRYENRRKLYEFKCTQVEALERYLEDSDISMWYNFDEG